MTHRSAVGKLPHSMPIRTPRNGPNPGAAHKPLRGQDGRPAPEAGDKLNHPVPRSQGQLGAIVDWDGRGELARAQIAGVLSQLRLPPSLLPTQRSGLAQAATALRLLEADGYAPVRRGRGAWDVGRRGEESIARVTLTDDEIMKIDGPHDLKVRILGEWHRLREEERYPAADVTYWLRKILRDRHRALRASLGWFVPEPSAPAIGLCRAVADTGWGVEWTPGIPQYRSPELISALADGLRSEVAEIRRDVGFARQEATSRDGSDIGARAARNFIDRLRDTAHRAVWYSGPAIGVPQDAARGAIIDLCDELQPLSAGGLSGAELWTEVTT